LCVAEIAAICTTKAPPGVIAGAVGAAACVELELLAAGGTGRVVAGGRVVARADAGVSLAAGSGVITAGVGAGDVVVVDGGAEGERGDGLKLSKVELPVPAGWVSFVAAGSGAFETVVDLRPRLYPKPKKTAHSSTSPRKIARIAPVLSVSSRSRSERSSWSSSRRRLIGSCCEDI